MAKGGNGDKSGGYGGGGQDGGTVTYTGWVFFGDSLTDNGDFYALATQILVDPFPLVGDGYDQVFSDGAVYADVAMDLFGVTGGDYQNYALGSARALGSRTVATLIDEYSPVTAYDIGTGQAFTYDPLLPGYDTNLLGFDINLHAQVDRYLQDNPVIADGTTASIFIGANDIPQFEADWWEFLFGDPVGDYADRIADRIYAEAMRLVSAGVDRIVLNTLPIAASFPIFALGDSNQQNIGDDLIDATNSEIMQRAGSLASAGVAVEVVRFDYLSGQVEDDGAAFGFLEVDQPYLLGTGGDPIYEGDAEAGTATPRFDINPLVADLAADQVAYFDYLHPSAALHGVMGVFQYESLTSETTLLSDAGQNRKLGSADDLAFAGDGADTLNLNRGDDVGFGGRGDDTVIGGAGSDIVSGGGGADSLTGDDGEDLLAGGTGNDTLSGGARADILIDGLGSDTLDGGTGNDVFLYVDGAMIGGTTQGDVDSFLGGGGSDTAYLVLTGEAFLSASAEWTGGDVTFSAIGLSLASIEAVVFLAERADLDTLAFSGDLGERYAEGQLWGLV